MSLNDQTSPSSGTRAPVDSFDGPRQNRFARKTLIGGRPVHGRTQVQAGSGLLERPTAVLGLDVYHRAIDAWQHQHDPPQDMSSFPNCYHISNSVNGYRPLPKHLVSRSVSLSRR
jgi:hypothetical protein